MRSLRRYVPPFILYLSLSVLSLRSIFLDFNPMAFHDLSPIFRIEQLSRPFEIPWDHKSNLGTPNMLTGNAVYNVFLYLFSAMSGSVILGHKLLLVFLIALSGLGFYLLFSYLLKSRTGPLLAGICSVFNIFLYTRWYSGHNTLILAYALLPYALLLFFLRKPASSLAGGLLSSLILAASPHIAYLEFILIALYSLFQLRGGIRKGLYTLMLAFIFILAAMAPNVPFLYLIFKVDLPVYSVRAEEAFVYIGMEELLPILPAIAFAIFVVWASLFFRPAKPSVRATKESFNLFYGLLRKYEFDPLFFLLLSIIGGLMVVLPVTPLGFVYEWLFQNVPGLFMFRESTKFLLLFSISVSYFVGLAGDRIAMPPLRRGKKAGLILLIALIFTTSWPFLTGDMAGKVGTVKVPSEYEDLYDRLQSDPSDYRVAFMPPASWAINYSWSSRWFLDPIVSLQAKPTVEIKGEMDLTKGAKFTRWVYITIYSNRTEKWPSLLGLMGASYVILRKDADVLKIRDDMRPFSTVRTLSLVEGPNPLQLEDDRGDIVMFRNPRSLPHMYMAEGYGVIVGDRGALIALAETEFDFKAMPLAFSTDLKGPDELLRSDLIVFQGDPFFDLLALYVKALKPWEHAPLSTDVAGKWVRGDLIWYLFEGGPYSAPDGFIITVGKHEITLPLYADHEGDYEFFAQVYFGLPGAQGIEFIFDGNEHHYVATDQGRGYRWVSLGVHRLKEGENGLLLRNLGGPAALSKVIYLPPDELNEYISKLEKDMQAYQGRIMYVFQDFMGSAGGTWLNFTNFRPSSYYLDLRLRNVTYLNISIDGRLSSYTLKGSSLTIGPIELERGPHVIKLGYDTHLDLLILREPFEGKALTSPSYVMLSGSEYELKIESPGYLAFLESGSGYWRLRHDGKDIAPITAFNYASLFKVDEPGTYRLVFLGMDYLKQGILLSIISFIFLIPLTLLARRVKGGEERG